MKQFIVMKNEAQRRDLYYEIDKRGEMAFMVHADSDGNARIGFAAFLRKENNRGWTLETFSLTGSSTIITLGRGLWEKTVIEP